MKHLALYRILTVVCGALLFAATVFVLIRWPQTPDNIPTHYNFAGEADAYGGKGVIIFEIVTAWVIFIMMTILAKFPKTWNIPVKVTSENSARLYGITRAMLEIVKLLTTLLFVIMFTSTALNASLPGFVIIIITAALLLTIVVGIFLMYRNR